MNVGEALETGCKIAERLIFTPGFPAEWEASLNPLCVAVFSSVSSPVRGSCCLFFFVPLHLSLNKEKFSSQGTSVSV